MGNQDKIFQKKIYSHSLGNYNSELGWDKFQSKRKKNNKIKIARNVIVSGIAAIFVLFIGIKIFFHSNDNDKSLLVKNASPIIIKKDSVQKNIAMENKKQNDFPAKENHRKIIPEKQKIKFNPKNISTQKPIRSENIAKELNDHLKDTSQENLAIINPSNIRTNVLKLEQKTETRMINVNEIEGASEVFEQPKITKRKNIFSKLIETQQINNTSGYSKFDKLKITF